jgi:predicted ribosomally synthesized peptide with nif11-like leader
MLEQIRGLFGDARLKSQLSKARSEDEALGLVVRAAASKGFSFTSAELGKLINVLTSPSDRELSHAELSAVAGGLRSQYDTHVHMSCCTDCPPTNGLCP